MAWAWDKSTPEGHFLHMVQKVKLWATFVDTLHNLLDLEEKSLLYHNS